MKSCIGFLTCQIWRGHFSQLKLTQITLHFSKLAKYWPVQLTPCQLDAQLDTQVKPCFETHTQTIMILIDTTAHPNIQNVHKIWTEICVEMLHKYLMFSKRHTPPYMNSIVSIVVAPNSLGKYAVQTCYRLFPAWNQHFLFSVISESSLSPVFFTCFAAANWKRNILSIKKLVILKKSSAVFQNLLWTWNLAQNLPHVKSMCVKKEALAVHL